MLKRCVLVSVVAFVAWGTGIRSAAALESPHEPYEFEGTHFSISIERFMGLDYTDFEGPGGGKLNGRLLLNASEPVPTSFARGGFDVFIERFSLGLAGGVAAR